MGRAMNSARDSLGRVLAVAALTFREAVRKKVVLAAALMSLAFLLLYGVALHYGQASIWKTSANGPGALEHNVVSAQLLYFGLYTSSFLVALTAVFTSAGTVSSDVDSGVIYGVLARPLRRGELVLGKFLGLVTMLVVFALTLNGAVVALARWQVATPLQPTFPAGVALLVLEPVPLLALAMLGSARLPTLANGVLCTAAYGLGFIGGLIEAIGGVLGSTTMGNIGIASSLLMPLDALHRLSLSLLMPQGLLFQMGGAPGIGGGSVPSVWMVVYAAAYIVVLLGFAVRAFGRRDL
jgi:Cu-processing system permease protein